jgi:hypothetical protein
MAKTGNVGRSRARKEDLQGHFVRRVSQDFEAADAGGLGLRLQRDEFRIFLPNPARGCDAPFVGVASSFE